MWKKFKVYIRDDLVIILTSLPLDKQKSKWLIIHLQIVEVKHYMLLVFYKRLHYLPHRAECFISTIVLFSFSETWV